MYKSITIRLTLFVIGFMLSGASPASAADDGWISLFDGKSLKGWIQKNGTAKYVVKDNAIVGTTSTGSPNSFLCTEKNYKNFELVFEVKVHDRLNSGVQIRSQTKPVDKNSTAKFGRVNGPQVEIESGPAEAGYVYGEATGRGWLTPPERLKKHDHFKNGQWNQYRIVAKGPRIQTWINGNAIEDLTDEAIFKSHPEGFIGLQVHGIPKNQGPYDVSWRKIRIKIIK